MMPLPLSSPAESQKPFEQGKALGVASNVGSVGFAYRVSVLTAASSRLKEGAAFFIRDLLALLPGKAGLPPPPPWPHHTLTPLITVRQTWRPPPSPRDQGW